MPGSAPGCPDPPGRHGRQSRGCGIPLRRGGRLGAADDDHFAAFFQQSFGHAVSQSPGAVRDDGFLPLNIESIQLVYSGLSLFVAGCSAA